MGNQCEAVDKQVCLDTFHVAFLANISTIELKIYASCLKKIHFEFTFQSLILDQDCQPF